MFEIKAKETRKILLYFFINPRECLYAGQLAGQLNLDSANTVKALKKLEKEGIIAVKKKKGRKYYLLNENYPLLRETGKIFMFKYGLDSILRNKLKNIKGLEEVYIYGSYAKGSYGAESDIDLLLIGRHSPFAVNKKALELQSVYGREFNVLDMSREEFEKRKKNKDEFIINIFKNKTVRII